MAPMKRNRLFSARLMPKLVAMATENYVADGVIDNTKWRKVSIPIADLVSPEFALDRVFIMSFVRMMGNNCFDICGESCYDNPTFYSASCDTPQDFYIDNIVLKAF